MPATRWSIIHRLKTDDTRARSAALAEVCRLYWRPLYTLARAWGRSPHDAEDLTQGFLASLCERGDLGEVAPERGRFRSLLQAAFRNHVTDAARQARTQRRGGTCETIPLDFTGAEQRFQRALTVEADRGALFDRQWALTIVQRAAETCRAEFDQRGQAAVFDLLEPVLVPGSDAPDYATLGRALGLSEAAVATRVKRFRTTFGQHLRRAVGDTVAGPAEVDEELKYLIRLI